MKEILVAVLFLGTVAAVSLPRGHFIHHDSNRRCWLCDPNLRCIPCPLRFDRAIPEDWSTDCEKPNADICSNYPNIRFPHPNLAKYYQCGPDGSDAPAVATECPCDHLFNVDLGECVSKDEDVPRFCIPVTHPDPMPCETTPTPTPTPTPSPCCDCKCVVPWWPCNCPCWGMMPMPPCMGGMIMIG
ncbi:hypothetical protein PVAND_003309 [Polypedilum vanderplanki]|uniref:Uncharacterized protein n=1 Tax=Polypedilum vanderplanki TaxID=319348 RepID=A0A9J6BVE9_POLVA|nr:hypothetical protein PVAND_003309 [Polypedilum vanderplanki]